MAHSIIYRLYHKTYHKLLLGPLMHKIKSWAIKDDDPWHGHHWAICEVKSF